MAADHTMTLEDDVQTLWDYHQLHQELRPCSVGIGLGSHDLGVARYCAELFHQHMFPLLVFTGSNSETTRAAFPRGEAIHYRDEAIRLGIPSDAVLVETEATNTEENLTFSRRLLAESGVDVSSVLLVSKPYQQRRVFATWKKLWPHLKVICAAQPVTLRDYVKYIGNSVRVADMLVGETQRVIEYPKLGYTIHQEVPLTVVAAYRNLVRSGHTSRIMPLGHNG